MIRTSFGIDRYTPGEEDLIAGTAASFAGDQPNGIIYCHGGNDLAIDVIRETAQRNIVKGIARHATVHAGDLGGNTFGNDLGLQRTEEAVAYLRAEWGAAGPLVFVGGSMGVITALVYTLNHPDDVKAIAGVIPGLDLQSLVDNGMAGQVNAAYGGAYNDATDGPTHSPIQFADQIADDLPIHFWTASNDTATVPAVTTAWLAARPQTGHTDLGALGHTDAAVAASVAGVTAFVKTHTTPAPLR